MANKKSLQLFINPKEIDLDPEITVYQVEVVKESEKEGDLGTVWTEAFGSFPELKNFLKGFQVACNMAGVSFQPEYIFLTQGAIDAGEFAAKEEVKE